MKKLLAITLLIVMVLSIASCGGDKADKNSDVPTLVWYVHGDKQKDVASVMEEVNKITVPAIGAKVDLRFIDQGAYSEKMKMMMASGTEFDLCFTGYVNSYTSAAQRGGLLSLDDYLKDMPELYNSIPDYTWKTVKYNGSIYAVPNLQVTALQMNFYTFKDLADKYGLTEKLKPLEKIDLATMEEYLQKIKDNEPSYYPVRFNYDTSFFQIEPYSDSVMSGVSAYYDKNGKLKEITNRMYHDKMEWALEKAKEWYDRGFVREDIISMSSDTAEHNAGKYACWMEKWKPGILQEHLQKFGKEVVSYQLSNNTYPSHAPDAMTGISRTSKHPELAIKLIELVNTNKELYNLICFGVEGKHYNLDENDRVVYNDEGGYIPKACWKFGNQFNAMLLPGQPEDVWEQTKLMNDTAIRSPLAGFNVDQSTITSEIASVASVESEFSKMTKGAGYKKSTFEAYTKKMKEAGIDTILKEINRQYKQWLKEQK